MAWRVSIPLLTVSQAPRSSGPTKMAISLLATAAAVVAAAAPPPHIVFFMADDLGRANVGFMRDDAPVSEVRTPAIDALASDGLVLERMYA